MGSKNKFKKKTGVNNGGDTNLIKDPRFSKAHHDPRFQNVPKNKAKVKVDSRFDSMFTNKKFGATSSAAVDKRGKPKPQSENELRRYYHSEGDVEAKPKTKKDKKKMMMAKELLNRRVDDDEEEEEEEEKVSENSESASEDEKESSESELEAGLSDDTDTDTDTDTGSDDEIDGDELLEDGEASVEVEDVPVIEKETHRLAVVNMDWTQVKAVDLLVMLNSCLPKGGQIKSVSVYPSDFGLQRMEEEAVRGPVALFENDKVDGGSDEDDSDEDEVSDDDEDADAASDDDDDGEDAAVASDSEDEDEVNDKEDVDEGDVGSDSEDEHEDNLEDDGEYDDDDGDDDDDEDEDDDGIDNEKLRAYEKSRLRYYYAVVDCESIATADYLYKSCDGIEFERSSNVLDLRFIPDSMEFKHPPRDVATEVPAEYEGLDFQTRALQQSNTLLSWDDDEPHRVKTLRRNFTEKQLAEMELSEFLASDESESDEDGNDAQDPSEKKKKKADMYRALIQSGDGSEGEDEGQNMEVTFATGLEDISKKVLEKKEKGQETVFEAYLRKKKEKKIARKNNTKTSSDDDSNASDDQTDDFFEEPPSVKKSKKDGKGKKKEEKTELEKEAEASRAELELLLADEDGADKKLKGYNMKHKKKSKKGQKGEETLSDTNLPTVDVDDPRFSALYNNPGYALDPTDPQFKRSATYYRQLAQAQHKGPKEHEVVEPMEASTQKKDKNAEGTSQKDKHELSAMVKSLKMKTQQRSVPSTVKRKNKTESSGPTSGKKHKLSGSYRSTKKARH